ncbi:hypothetical protein GCM10027174_02560 [Salinifilum aidingensis]
MAWSGGRPAQVPRNQDVGQQNTFTGRLTPEMLRGVLERAKELAGPG